jgi:hypothetical protein
MFPSVRSVPAITLSRPSVVPPVNRCIARGVVHPPHKLLHRHRLIRVLRLTTTLLIWKETSMNPSLRLHRPGRVDYGRQLRHRPGHCPGLLGGGRRRVLADVASSHQIGVDWWYTLAQGVPRYAVRSYCGGHVRPAQSASESPDSISGANIRGLARWWVRKYRPRALSRYGSGHAGIDRDPIDNPDH